MTHSGYRTKYTDLDNSFSRRRKRISSSEIIEDNLHLSSGAKGNKLTAFPEGTSHDPAVFDILEPGHDSLGMNCSNIGDCKSSHADLYTYLLMPSRPRCCIGS